MVRFYAVILIGLTAASCGGRTIRTIGTSQSTGSGGSSSDGGSSSVTPQADADARPASNTCGAQSGVCVSCGNGSCNYNGTIFAYCPAGIEGGGMCTSPRDCIACDGSAGTRWECLGHWLDLDTVQCSD
jgi:hypothetical protein